MCACMCPCVMKCAHLYTIGSALCSYKMQRHNPARPVHCQQKNLGFQSHTAKCKILGFQPNQIGSVQSDLVNSKQNKNSKKGGSSPTLPSAKDLGSNPIKPGHWKTNPTWVPSQEGLVQKTWVLIQSDLASA